MFEPGNILRYQKVFATNLEGKKIGFEGLFWKNHVRWNLNKGFGFKKTVLGKITVLKEDCLYV